MSHRTRETQGTDALLEPLGGPSPACTLTGSGRPMSVCDLQESKSVVCSTCSPGKQAPVSGHTAVTRPGTTGRGRPAAGKGLQMLVLGGRARGEWASWCSPHGPHSRSCWGSQRQRSPTSGSWRAPCPAWRHFLLASSSWKRGEWVWPAPPPRTGGQQGQSWSAGRGPCQEPRWPGRGASIPEVSLAGLVHSNGAQGTLRSG